jgi:hypothetical protein
MYMKDLWYTKKKEEPRNQSSPDEISFFSQGGEYENRSAFLFF